MIELDLDQAARNLYGGLLTVLRHESFFWLQQDYGDALRYFGDVERLKQFCRLTGMKAAQSISQLLAAIERHRGRSSGPDAATVLGKLIKVFHGVIADCNRLLQEAAA